jgi:protease I
LKFDLSGKNILIILPHRNFQDEEYSRLKSFLDDCHARTVVASSSREAAEGRFGITVTPDISIDDAKSAEFDAFILIGGVGSIEYWHDSRVHDLVRDADRNKKLIGAICLAPVTLANVGLLKGKKATAYNSARSFLRSKEIEYTGKPVEISDNIITAQDPEATEEFAEAIADQLTKYGQVSNI